MKNSKDIALYREMARLRKKCNELVPEVYACFAKVLVEEYKWDADQVGELFSQTQRTWNEIVKKDEVSGMIAWCEETTGIKLAQ